MDIYDEIPFDAENLVSSNAILTDILKSEEIEINNEYQEKDKTYEVLCKMTTPYKVKMASCTKIPVEKLLKLCKITNSAPHLRRGAAQNLRTP